MDPQKSPLRWLFADMACLFSQMASLDDSLWPFSLSGTSRICFFYEHQILAFSTKKASETSLTLLDTLLENVAEANLEPMTIKVFHFDE